MAIRAIWISTTSPKIVFNPSLILTPMDFFRMPDNNEICGCKTILPCLFSSKLNFYLWFHGIASNSQTFALYKTEFLRHCFVPNISMIPLGRKQLCSMSLEYLCQHLSLANFQREDFSACHYHKRSLVSQCLGHTRVKFQGINCEESRSLQYLPDAKHCKVAHSH